MSQYARVQMSVNMQHTNKHKHTKSIQKRMVNESAAAPLLSLPFFSFNFLYLNLKLCSAAQDLRKKSLSCQTNNLIYE